MQFATLLIAGAAAVSGAAVPRDVPAQAPQNFNVTNFAFSGTPHSVIANFQMDVTKADGSTGTPNCQTTTNTSPEVGPFNMTACEDPSWSVSFLTTNTSQGSGYSLQVTRAPGAGAANETGCLFIPASDIEYVQNPAGPTGNTYRVNYGPDFQMAYATQDNCVYA